MIVQVRRVRRRGRRWLRVLVGALWVGAHASGALLAAKQAAGESAPVRFAGWALVSIVLGLSSLRSFEV